MVTRAGPLPLSPTAATLAVHRLLCVCGAPAVPLPYAYSVVIAYSCRLVVVEVVCSVADWLRRRSSALWQTGYRGGRLLCGRLVIEEVVCSTMAVDWL